MNTDTGVARFDDGGMHSSMSAHTDGMDGRYFPASCCPGLRILFVCLAGLLLFALVALLQADPLKSPASLFAFVTLAGLLLGAPLFAVRGYRIDGDTLLVLRPLWGTGFTLHDLQSAEIDPDAMAGSLRVCGNGGLFSITGWYWNRRLGLYRAFVTTPSHAVVLRFPRRVLVVTPDDPEAFVAALPVPDRAP